MNHKISKTFLGFLLLFFFLSSSVIAQKNVTGRVINNATNDPIQGASVQIKGTKTGTSTNQEGLFNLQVPSDQSILVISSVGFQNSEISVSGKTSLGDIALIIQTGSLDEIVVTGYTSQAKKDITGAVSVINVDEMNKQPTGQLANQLQGQASGVTVLSSGQPGEEPQIRIRGINTFGNNTPLFVIDGVPTQNIADFNPNDVASVQVLKDAGAASIYGSRASNGVIIITTKKGRGKVQVTYDAYYGTQQPKGGNIWNILSPQDMAQLKFNALANSGTPVNAANPDALYGSGPTPVLPDYINPTGAKEGDASVNPSLYNVNPNYTSGDELSGFYRIVKANKTGTDWFHELNKPAPMQKHNLTVSGGSDQGRYFLSMEHFNQEGTIMQTYLKRYALRINTEFNLGKRIRIGENLSYSITDNNRNAPGEGGFLGMAFREQPLIPVRDIMGNFAGTFGGQLGNARNPVADAYRTRNNSGLNNRLFANVYGEADILPELTFRTSFGGESYAGTYHSFQYPTYENVENSSKNAYNESSYFGYNWTWTNTLAYKKIFDEHSLSLLAGVESYNNNYRDMGGSTSDYFTFDPNFPTLGSGAGTPTSYSNRSSDALWSQFGRLDYSFKNRYLLSATIRRDGSSRFINEQYGIFPAVTAAWRLSEESFMDNVTWISDLKIRGGWGVMGNQLNVGVNNGYFTFNSDKNASYYDIGVTNNSIVQGFRTGQIGNPDAKWERDINSNIGLDVTLLDGKVDFTIDYYRKDIKDLLFNPQLPATAGSGARPFVNVASMENTGLDMQLGLHTNIAKDLRLDASATFTTYNNKITKVTESADYFLQGNGRRFGETFNRNQVGHPVGAFYGYQIKGFWNEQAEIDQANQEAQKATSNPTAIYQTDIGLGRFRYQDTNGDGIITDADRTFIGSPHADFTYGLNLGLTYRNFDFSMFLYGSYGNDVWNNVKWWLDFYPSFAGAKSHTALYDSWRTDKKDAKAPIQENKGWKSTNGVPNSYFVEKGSYLRAKNVTLGYTFSPDVLRKAYISSFRIYVQAANLFTITNYSGADPEVTSSSVGGVTDFGVDEGAYPSSRNFIFGINLKF